jgi:NAD(P)-dependent dehydrogenase (short-subunit alcohol dehydrogenase family)
MGYATAITLARAGAAVVVNARREMRLEQLVAEIIAHGGKALAVPGDASDQVDIETILEQALSWNDGGSKYDIVVVNAGRGLAGGILNSDESRWNELYQLNVIGASHLMRLAGKYMVQ